MGIDDLFNNIAKVYLERHKNQTTTTATTTPNSIKFDESKIGKKPGKCCK